ncbi:head GIN domain-containing protein [Dysgonomonas gadei]|uniref:Putative auto-transporter adhesin head GIN domain-containing protein n=1 Tax=Dysgonomonas gadei ATCC BAA-286 TaxID=742766 RepID=F5J1S8_9BACT|nr:head GIN domain-containing protein [Dysgonomonas gadei]EGK00342.1 hypothetical protein HMPREF9455_03295 [Dysgonomonas gadei ATCC BAA-286]
MKVKSIILLVVCCVISLGISAQVVKEKKPVSSFNKIAVSGGIDIYFTQSNSHSLEIETDAENMPKIEITVSNGNLELRRKDGERFKRNSRIYAYVSAPALDAIAISGGSDFNAKELNNKGALSIAASGGADIEIDRLNVNEANFAFSGGSDCDIKDLRAKKLKIAASGGSDSNINIGSADEVSLSVSGGADAELSGKVKVISVSCSGGADVDIKKLTYETINAHKSGGGSISK